ncbi:MAG: hypothetical protein KAQ75_03940, partial [Bacteroidales bacterium]|nr:hypothetical protein [Bacteroidales bacterium]
MDNYIIRDYNNEDFETLNKLWQETELGGAQRDDNAQIIELSINIGGKLILLENTNTKEIF